MLRTLAASLLLLVGSADAQPFRVVASSPADGAAGVGLADTLRITFSAPLNPAAPPAMVTFPEDSVAFGTPSLSGDGRSLSYPALRTASTRYVHIVLDARAADGAVLERPFALGYTTAPTAGGFTVTGTVTAATGTSDAAVVALVGFDGSALSVADATVLDGTSGAYALGPVPIGIYSVAAVRFPHDDPDRTFAYGFYDPDGDGTPNPVIVPFGVNLTITEPEPVLARARFAVAEAEALSRAADAAFYEILETPADTSGRAVIWSYAFYSPSQDSTITVVDGGLFPLVFATAGPPEALAPVFGTWGDSDVAMAAAEAAGGTAFRAAHAASPQTLSIRAGLQPDVPTAATPCYRVAYRAFDPSSGAQTDSLLVYVTMAGGIVVPTAGEAGPAGEAPILEPPRPNPSNGRLILAFTLARPANARLEVFDATGRLVAVVAEGPFGPGRHAVAWEPAAGLPAGMYAIRLAAGGATAVRPVVIRR